MSLEMKSRSKAESIALRVGIVFSIRGLTRLGFTVNFYMKGPQATTRHAPKKFAKGETIAGDVLNSSGLPILAGFDSGGNYALEDPKPGNVDWLKATPGSISGYVGFKATVNEQDIYGWIKVAVRAIAWTESTTATTRPDRIQVISYGYQPDGGFIVAGAIPEPSTTATALGLLALGAVGLSRKRKHKAEIQSS